MRIKTTTQLLDIGPRLAAEWLADRWGEQRKIRPRHVEKLATDMTDGRFKVSPDAILRICGKLANGQHRLEAVVQSGTKQTFIVMESNDKELYKVIDAGLKRLVQDSLISMPYSHNIPSIARWVIGYEKGTNIRGAAEPSKTNRDMTQSAMIEYCVDNQEVLIEAAQFVSSLWLETRLLSFSIGGAIYCIAASRQQLDKAKLFLTAVYLDGGDNAAGDLRNRLIQMRGKRTKEKQGYIFGIVLKAFKSYCNGTRPGVLKWAVDEALPTI